MDRKRDEQAGHSVEYHALTNAAYVICDELPATGLNQDMHDPTVQLHIHDIVTSPGITNSDGLDGQISASLISDAIKRLHPEAVKKVFQGQACDYPEFPRIHCLPAKPTRYRQFAGVSADEGTIEGTYKVHDDLFIEQLNLIEDKDFDQRLYLVHGDQLTVDRIRAVKRERQLATRSYDRRQWIHPVSSWFHIQMNLLNTIIRTHWDAPGAFQTAVHTISSDATRWGRSQSNRDSVKYHLMEPIVAQGFTARVTALFYAAMQRRGIWNPHTSDMRHETIGTVIETLSTAQFLELVEDVRVTAFTRAAWSESIADVDFRTMCRMLQEVELFLTVRQAVKYGDIGMLRRVVDPLIVTFFGAAQYSYGREMLYYRWNLSSVNTPELQHAILSSGLVNWSGRSNSFKPIDLHLEHLNCSAKLDFKMLKNSTHDIGIIFRRTALCSTWVQAMRRQMEGIFGEDMPATHTSASAIPDMFLTATTILRDGYAEPRGERALVGVRPFDSCDIFLIGINMLEERIEIFNNRHASGSALAELDPAAIDDVNAIGEYARVFTEEFDALRDPTLSIPIIDLTYEG